MARSAQSRFFDNIGRRIRHLNEDLRNPENDNIRQVGLKRQIENLENFRKELRKEASKNPDGKLTAEQIYEATIRMKTDDNLSTKKKVIDEITIKDLVGSGFKGFSSKEVSELISDPEIQALMKTFSDLKGEYIGQSGNPTLRTKANIATETAKEILKNELTEKQRQLVNQIVKDIETSLDKTGRDGVIQPIEA